MDVRIAPSPVRKVLRVKASQAHAFEVFTAGLGRWWPRSHSVGKSPLENAVIEPRVGGRWYERGEDGSECDWGRVLAWDPPARLLLAWQLNGQWQFDLALVTEVGVAFIAEGPLLTRVEFEHRGLERFGDRAEAVRESISSPKGWPGILERDAAAAEA